MDWSNCSEVEQTPPEVGGMPLLKGTRIPAKAVSGFHDAGCAAVEIAELFHLKLEQVQAVLDFASRNTGGLPEEHGSGWYRDERGVWQLPSEDDAINFTDMPVWTPAQWSRAVRGWEGRKVLRARWEAGRAAREAFWAAARPIASTEGFKRWFSASKAVTEDGKPEVLFHATDSGSEFYCSQGLVGTEYGADFGTGYYFFRDPETALSYRNPPNRDTGDSIKSVAVYLAAVNPLILRTGRHLKGIWAGAGGKDVWFAMTSEKKAEYIQRLGFDSVRIHKFGQWVVYRPAQIMAAIIDVGETGRSSSSIMTDYFNCITTTE